MKKLISILCSFTIASTSSIASSSQILSTNKTISLIENFKKNNLLNNSDFILDSISTKTVATSENAPIIKYLINTLSSWFEGSYKSSAHYIGNLTPEEQVRNIVCAVGNEKYDNKYAPLNVRNDTDPSHSDEWAMVLTKSVWNNLTINGINADGSKNPGKPLLPPQLETDKFFINDNLGTVKQKEDAILYVFSQEYLTQNFPTPPPPYKPPVDPPFTPDPQANIWKVKHGLWWFGYTTYYLNEAATLDFVKYLNKEGQKTATPGLLTSILGCITLGLEDPLIGAIVAVLGLIISIESWDCSKLASEISGYDKGKGINYVSWANIPLPIVHSNSIYSVKKNNYSELNDDVKVFDTDLTKIPTSDTYSKPNLEEENLTSASSGNSYFNPDGSQSGQPSDFIQVSNYSKNSTDVLKTDLLQSNGVWDLIGKFGSTLDSHPDLDYFTKIPYDNKSFSTIYNSDGIVFDDNINFTQSYSQSVYRSISYNIETNYTYYYGTKNNLPHIDLTIHGSLSWIWAGSSSNTESFYNILNNIYIFNDSSQAEW